MTIPRSIYSLNLLALMLAMSCEADPLARQLFAGVHAAYNRHIREFNWAEAARKVHDGIHQIHMGSPKINAPRKLTDISCSMEAQIVDKAFNECIVNKSFAQEGDSDSEWAIYCNSTCASKIQEFVAAAQKKECESEMGNIRFYGDLCSQGPLGGATRYCHAMNQSCHTWETIQTLKHFDPDLKVNTLMCENKFCAYKVIDRWFHLGIFSRMQKLTYKMMLKHACTKPSEDSPTTCWKDFAKAMKPAGKDSSLFDEMVNSPATFCANKCKRAALLDMMRAADSSIIQMTKNMLDFSFMQKEDGIYCISVAMGKVALPNTLNYNGALVTKPVCEKSSTTNSNSADEPNEVMQCTSAKGMCAPWCKDAQYSCHDSVGKCDDYLNCDTQEGAYPSHSCTCTAKIGQLMSYAGCCIAASVDLTCGNMKADNRSYDSTVDITMCDEDPVTTQAKGFKMSRAMSRVESCGFVVDPRCSHGQPVKVIKFDLTFDNVDTEKVCAATSVPTENLIQILSDSLSIQASDITIDLCADTAEPSTLISTVSVQESGATNLGMMRLIKKEEMASGRLSTSIEPTLVWPPDRFPKTVIVEWLTPVAGKLVTVAGVGNDTESTKRGVAGSTLQQINQLSVASEEIASEETTADGVVGLSLSTVLLIAFVPDVN